MSDTVLVMARRGSIYLPKFVAFRMQREPQGSPKTMSELPPTRYTRLNPDGSGRFAPDQQELAPPKPTRSQTAVEWTLFGVIALILILAGLALCTAYSPSHKI